MDDRTESPTTADAWMDRVAYHRDRALQEARLAERAETEVARTAHLLLSERHAQLMASAESVADMPDPQSPQSSLLHLTGSLMRQSYSDQGYSDQV